jgi:chromosome segregation protein
VYLKHVELHGFKTFAERCHLEFGPGVSAVVGPNGSGKSNIADAIQWVLGEQSLKSLRSGKGSDVIFAGTDGKRPVGMAEVTAVFDNSDRVLPLDFSEVSVTRRVHRSGDGDFFINGVACRLRDIQELFLDTGIGKEAYSVINQTEIDAILSIRPEDRRELFEEVAGIKKYRVRKREAERRLEHTRTNLIRITDIINELEQQIGPLAEQSEQARRYQELANELNGLKRGLLVDRYRSLLQARDRVAARQEELAREVEQVRAQGAEIETSEDKYRAELTEAEDRLERARAHAASLAAQATAADGEAALRRERLTALAARRTQIEADIEQLQAREAEAEGEIARARADAERLATETQTLEEALAAQQERLSQAEAGLESRRQEVEEARRDYVACLEEMATRRNALSQAESLLQSAQRTQARLGERRAEAERQAQGARAEAEATRAEIGRLQAEHERLRQSLGSGKRDLEAATEARDQHLAHASDLREQLSSAAARRQALAETAASAEGHAPAVRAVIAAAAEGALRGEFRLIPEVITVSSEHERAVEAAIGPAVDFIITARRGEVVEAVAYLNANQLGRAAFLPLADLQPIATLEPPAGARLALELIACEARYLPALAQLLGQVLVAPDLEAASAMAARVAGWRKIVTLGGEVLYPSGAISGGSPGREARLIGRRREIEELAAAIVSLQRELDAAWRQAEEAAEAMLRLRQEADAAAAESEACGQRLQGRQSALHASEAEAQQAQAQVDGIASEMAALEGDIADNIAERDRAAAEVAALEARQAEAEQALAGAEEAIKAAQAERQAVSDELVAARLALTELRGQVSACDAAAQRGEKARGEAAAMVAQRRQRVEDVERERAATEQEAESCAARCQEFVAARERAEADVGEALAARDEIGESLAQGAGRRKAHGQCVEEVQARLHRSELRATQIEGELGYVRRNLWDDHRLEPEAALAQHTPLPDRAAAQARAEELEAAVAEMGLVNLGAVEEYERVGERLRFLTAQRADLEQARDDIHRAIAELDATSRGKFMEAFEALAREFDAIFQRLFDGGSTELVICDPENVLESGIDIHVQLPGKRPQNLLLLSGGERALTALALLLAMLKVRPSPFVILDEIDAPLDATNVGKYTGVLKEFAERSQFIVITHNPGTMEAADALHGVTMDRPGVSKLVSVRLTDDANGKVTWATSPGG